MTDETSPDTPTLTAAQQRAAEALSEAPKLLLLMPTLEDCRAAVWRAAESHENPCILWVAQTDAHKEILAGAFEDPEILLLSFRALADADDLVEAHFAGEPEDTPHILVVEAAPRLLGNDDVHSKLIKPLARRASVVWGCGTEITIHPNRPDIDPFLGLEARDAQVYDVMQDLNIPCTPNHDSILLYVASLGFTQARRDLVADIDLSPISAEEKAAVRPFCPDLVTCTADPPCSDPSMEGCERVLAQQKAEAEATAMTPDRLGEGKSRIVGQEDA